MRCYVRRPIIKTIIFCILAIGAVVFAVSSYQISIGAENPVEITSAEDVSNLKKNMFVSFSDFELYTTGVNVTETIKENGRVVSTKTDKVFYLVEFDGETYMIAAIHGSSNREEYIGRIDVPKGVTLKGMKNVIETLSLETGYTPEELAEIINAQYVITVFRDFDVGYWRTLRHVGIGGAAVMLSIFLVLLGLCLRRGRLLSGENWHKSQFITEFEQKYAATREEKEILAFGAILFTQNYESSRTFKVMNPYWKKEDSLEDAWDIETPTEAKETLKDLVACEVHVPYANAVLRTFLSCGNAAETANKLDESYPSDDVIDSIEAYHEAIATLRDKYDYTSGEISIITDLSAWDLGRAGFIARFGCAASLVPESSAWEYMRKAAYQSTQIYRSWREFGAAYVIGRSIAYGGMSDLEEVLDFLLKNPNSPWIEIDFRSIAV